MAQTSTAQTRSTAASKPIEIPGYLTVGKVISYAMYIWVIFGIIMLGLRVFLLAFSANPITPFVSFVYDTSDTFLQPFRGIFPPRTINETGYLDVAAIFAIIIYALLGWAFSALISYIQSKIDVYKMRAQEQARQQQLARMEAQRQAAEAAAKANTASTTTTTTVTTKKSPSSKSVS